MIVPEITEVKEHLDLLRSNRLITAWELPYEDLLTRRSAAVFFINPATSADLAPLWMEFEKYDNFSKRLNTERDLSELAYRLTFSKDEKEKAQNGVI